MPFSAAVVEAHLLKCRRYCCLCHKFKGTGIEIHHIEPNLAAGRDAFGNGIPLCFDCHGVVGNYNTAHPRGRKYRPVELRLLRDEWYEAIEKFGMRAGEMVGVATDNSSAPHQTVSGTGNVVAGRDVLVNSRKVVRVSFTPGPGHISETTAFQAKKLVEELVELESQTRRPSENPFGKWWSKIKQTFRVSTYRAIPIERSDELIQWLQCQKALLRPKLRRAAPETWRNQFYTAIYSRSKEIGINKEALYALAHTKCGLRHPITSLKELGEQDLTRLHQVIFSL